LSKATQYGVFHTVAVHTTVKVDKSTFLRLPVSPATYKNVQSVAVYLLPITHVGIVPVIVIVAVAIL